MKTTGFLVLVLAVLFACTSHKGLVNIKKNARDEAVKDSVEYELITFDTRFETWYSIHNSPASYRLQGYYETWNRRYVSEWNNKAMTGNRNGFFEPIVGYEPTVDYGFELNHKLFYYFQYVEKVLKIQVLDSGGPSIPIY
jgi:hypothetical protein